MGLEKINEMCKKSGLNLDEIAKRANVPKGTLSKITAGITKNPGLETVAAIVHSLGYRLDDLDDYPKSDRQLSPAELDHIKKYRRIDSDGKKIVDMILDDQVKRIEGNSSKLISLPLASRGGGKSEITITEEDYEKAVKLADSLETEDDF